MLTRDKILGLKKGEVIAYETDMPGVYKLLHVDEVDLERGVVSGEITLAAGVNAIPIEELVRGGVGIAKWEGDLNLREAYTSPFFTAPGLTEQDNPKYRCTQEDERMLKHLNDIANQSGPFID